MKNVKLIYSSLLLGTLALGSCSKHDPAPEAEIHQVADAATKEMHKERFAAILSKAVHDREDVRAFLKKEALVQFDKNYDVFYPMVQNKQVGGESFRDVLLAYSSEEEIGDIERNVPLLNILLANIPMLGVKPEEMDTTEEEIPVAVAKESATSLYLNGTKEGDLEKGEVPGFHLFVVNENRRVTPIRPSMQKMASTRENLGSAIPGTSFAFKSPNYDGTRIEVQPLLWRPWYEVDPKAREAYKHFYKDDGSVNQRAYQRDYIYYGITPQNRVGSLNRSVKEYINFIEINPNAFLKISDQDGDPRLRETWFQHWGPGLNHQQIVDRMWTQGAFEFVFEFICAGKAHAVTKHIGLKPDDIWHFDIQSERRNRTWFRKERHTYWIDPNRFTSKTVWLGKEKIDLDPWNLAEEGLHRYVNIYEEDGDVEITTTETYESTHVNTSQFKAGGSIKLDVGLGLDLNAGGESTSSSTTKKSNSVTRKYKQGSDALGSTRIYFYDPIIIGSWGIGNVKYEYDLNFYNTGYVKFGIAVK